MTVDERIEKLAEAQTKTEKMLAEIVISIGRLERISGALLINDEELDRRLTELENRRQRKPQ